MRTNGAWQLTEPLTYPAQSVSIEKLVTELAGLTPASSITALEGSTEQEQFVPVTNPAAAPPRMSATA